METDANNNLKKKSFRNSPIFNFLVQGIREILFITIGIFLAIQLNNWNDKRISNKLALEHLKGIKENLVVDTFFYDQIIKISESELKLLSNRLNTVNYEDLSLDSLDKFIINSLAMEYKINNESYQKILNLGLPRISENEELEVYLDNYYNGISSRFDAYVEYDYEQTNKEHDFWFYNQEIAEMALTARDTFPFIEDKAYRKKNLVKLFKSSIARNYMRSEIYRTQQMTEFVKYMDQNAVALINAIEKEIAETDEE